MYYQEFRATLNPSPPLIERPVRLPLPRLVSGNRSRHPERDVSEVPKYAKNSKHQDDVNGFAEDGGDVALENVIGAKGEAEGGIVDAGKVVVQVSYAADTEEGNKVGLWEREH